jgi:hypothetical protein
MTQPVFVTELQLAGPAAEPAIESTFTFLHQQQRPLFCCELLPAHVEPAMRAPSFFCNKNKDTFLLKLKCKELYLEPRMWAHGIGFWLFFFFGGRTRNRENRYLFAPTTAYFLVEVSTARSVHCASYLFSRVTLRRG